MEFSNASCEAGFKDVFEAVFPHHSKPLSSEAASSKVKIQVFKFLASKAVTVVAEARASCNEEARA
jgi:hypothetical protein